MISRNLISSPRINKTVIITAQHLNRLISPSRVAVLVLPRAATSSHQLTSRASLPDSVIRADLLAVGLHAQTDVAAVHPEMVPVAVPVLARAADSSGRVVNRAHLLVAGVS